MSNIRVPKSMTKLLSPDEYVIGKITSPDRDLYATNKRVLVFQKSLWYALFFLLGILPGLLAWLLTPKSLRRFVFNSSKETSLFIPAISAFLLIFPSQWDEQ